MYAVMLLINNRPYIVITQGYRLTASKKMRENREKNYYSRTTRIVSLSTRKEANVHCVLNTGNVAEPPESGTAVNLTFKPIHVYIVVRYIAKRRQLSTAAGFFTSI